VNDSAIRIQGVSKCHLIYERPEDRLKQILVPRLQRVLGLPQRQYYRPFWALRDVSMEISRGQTVGIIGRNGAGKSTLLQLLCGTLCPTEGNIHTNGRIAALLELGSGFNAEFTGRENVFLNATVLGLSQEQIRQRFDAIAAFADIGDFIDQPVKTYSSGMLVRLAFAVIAHVDADILVIDEALAVGDAIFTQKCMRFLRKFKESGTLVFVSHDSHSVIALCDKALWLDRGKTRMFGDAKEVAEAYMQYSLQETYGDSVQLKELSRETDSSSTSDASFSGTSALQAEPLISEDMHSAITLFDNLKESAGWQTGSAQIAHATLTCPGKPSGSVLRGGDIVELMVQADIIAEINSPIIGFLVKDRLGQTLFGENTFDFCEDVSAALPGSALTARFEFQLPILPSGNYSLTVAIAEGTPSQNVQHHWIHDALIFSVIAPKPWLGLMGIPFRSISLTKQARQEKRQHA
jgi:lipopolysaccharide transport system ATP-binding protein